MTINKAALARRVDELEQQSGGRIRLCWVGDQPNDVAKDETLVVLSWQDEDQP